MDDPPFDPYYRWLAIPPAEQPPHCYRLLGVALFEADLDVIASAADRQMGHLRSYQNGPYSAYSQRLLNEVSQARLTLLQQNSKAQYDAALRVHLYGTSTPATSTPPNSGTWANFSGPAPIESFLPTPPGSSTPSLPAASVVSRPPITTTSAARNRRSQPGAFRQFVGIVLGGLAGCLLGAVILTVIGVDLPGGIRWQASPPTEEPPVAMAPATDDAGAIVDQAETELSQAAATPATKIAFSQIPAHIDPWGNVTSQQFLFTPATYSLKYAERDNRAYFDIFRHTGGKNQRAGSMAFADCMQRSATVLHGYDARLSYHYYYAKSQSEGQVVLRLRAASDALFDGPGEICLLGWLAGCAPDHRMLLEVYADYDLPRMTPASSAAPLASKTFSCATSDNQFVDTHLINTLKFEAHQQPELYVVLRLSGGTTNAAVAAQWKLHNEIPSHYRPQGATTIRFSTIPRPAQGVASNSENSPPVTSLPTPDEFDRLVQLHEQDHTSTDPQAWLDLARRAGGSADRKALFLIAARHAADSGNLIMLEQIFTQFQRETSDDLTSLKLDLLVAMASAPNKQYSPATLAIALLQALKQQPITNARNASKALALAKAAALEAGDRNLQDELSRWESTLPRGNSLTTPALAKSIELDENKLQQAKVLIKELFAKDLEKADTAEKRRQLAGKMQALARVTQDDPEARYLLLFEAATLLARFDSPEAWDAWEQLSKESGFSLLNEKMSALDALQKKAKQPSEYKLVASRYLTLLNKATQEDAFREAELLSSRAEAAAKKGGDKMLEHIVAQRSKALPSLQKAFEAAKPSRDKLQTHPQDPEAALEWGRYLCCYRDEWEHGLPIMAQGGNAPLAVLAKRDLAQPTDATAQASLGNEWWQLADQQSEERAKEQLRGRAVYWYRLAAPSLSGIVGATITKRIDDFASNNSPIPLKMSCDALAMVDVAAHASSPDWGRQGAIVGVTPGGNTRQNRLIIPLAINGSYEVQSKIEWQSRFYGQIELELPIGDRLIVVNFGRTPAIRSQGPASNVRIEHSPVDFQSGKIYQLGAKVTQDGHSATVQATLNGRPYASWSGTVTEGLKVSDVRRVRFAMRQPGQEMDENAFRQSTLALVGGPNDAFAIGTFQFQLTSGWAEPLTR